MKSSSTETPRWMMVAYHFLSLCLIADGVQSVHAALVPELISINATIHTMNAHGSVAEAARISGNRIAAVGTNASCAPNFVSLRLGCSTAVFG